MRSSTLRTLLCAVTCSLGLLQGLQAQGLAQTLDLARQLQQNGQFEAAVLAYERVLFFDQQNEFRREVHLYLANCYGLLGEPEAALKNLNLAYYLSETVAEQLEIQFRQVAILLLNGRFLDAKEELLSLEPYVEGVEERRRYHFYMGIASFGSEAFREAEDHFHAAIGGGFPEVHQQLTLLFLENDRVSRINPKRAAWLSAFLPGLGQVVHKDWKNGVNSFLLTGGLAALGVHVALQLTPLDAMFAVGSWFFRYYQGGIGRAREIARNRQVDERAAIYQRVLSLVEQVQMRRVRRKHLRKEK